MQINVVEYWLNYVSDEAIRNKIAVVEEGKETSFGELFDRAGVLGEQLIKNFSDTGRPMAIFLPKCAEQMAVDMAVLYSGNAYSNLDIRQPEERTKRIIEQLQPLCILTTSNLAAKLEQAGDVPVICLEDIQGEVYDLEVIKERLAGIVDTDPLCIINTSGSTGTPKGVVMNHRSIIDFLDQGCRVLDIGHGERIGSLSPVYFDIFTLEFYLILWKQAVFVCIPENLAIFPERLAEFLEEKQIDFICWVPTVMVNMANLDILAGHPLKKMKKVLFAGEVFPLKHLAYWREHLPQAEFINMYGPIEITVDCLYHKVTKEDIEKGELPIGKVFPNTKVYILDEEDKECQAGETGELCVSGTSLAMGYYRDKGKTERAFVQNPLNKAYIEIIYRTGDMVRRRDDGEIIFLGRRDFQVKHLGYRIELGEIEAVAVGMTEIDNACVLYDHGEKKIVLIYEGREEIPFRDIREGIGKVLPKYMLPNICYRVEEMPRNPNGKIDRKRLQDEYVCHKGE
ncbi:amino acid adenylation domain-containing protein [Selenomonas ruminantium]|uniref:Amino acid adenylation domain-containing protein n=1 Tax=Selenomonas ruminantium TaxID=971 RepID=A0A1M6W2A8_SELRU|nr:amino acid adenylation domain-containing protein [Selenomonas ruminantium]SHK87891.1 amino acid adenylation domain-containing protein [Selenomonas ruminantium]